MTDAQEVDRLRVRVAELEAIVENQRGGVQAERDALVAYLRRHKASGLREHHAREQADAIEAEEHLDG